MENLNVNTRGWIKICGISIKSDRFLYEKGYHFLRPFDTLYDEKALLWQSQQPKKTEAKMDLSQLHAWHSLVRHGIAGNKWMRNSKKNPTLFVKNALV